jgi:hypothetical protein
MGLHLNFGRGKQMIVHDLRLNNPYTNPPSRLNPPAAFNVRRCQKSDSTLNVIHDTGSVARAAGRLDALHFMAHGSPGHISVGSPGLSFANAKILKSLAGHVGFIVFFSCQVGRGTRMTYSLNFGNAVSADAKCPCIACYATQIYSWASGNTIDFGSFEGTVYVFDGPKVTAKSKDFDLEKRIFG